MEDAEMEDAEMEDAEVDKWYMTIEIKGYKFMFPPRI